MNGTIYLTSFYGTDTTDDPYWSARQQRLHRSALNWGGIDEVIPWNAERLSKTNFAIKNWEILKLPRGYGYWLWKPYIILDALQNIEPDAYLIYHDIGRPQRGDSTRGYTLERDIGPLIRWADCHNGIYPGVYMPHHGKQKQWTKRDCFVLMGCDNEKYWEATQIQATYNIWKNNTRTREFVQEWLETCEDSRILTDSENKMGEKNLPGFKQHRHDQSILTNLCVKHDIAAFGSPDHPILMHRNLNSLIRHAHRDELTATGENLLADITTSRSSVNYDRSMNRWIELYFEERRRSRFSILLLGLIDPSVLAEYAPMADINSAQDLSDRDISHRHFDLIIIRQDGKPSNQFDHAVKLFERLNPDGMLICGQIEKSWDQFPAHNRNTLALVRDFWKNKSITHTALEPIVRDYFNANLLTAYTAWDRSDEKGNAYFVRYP